MVPSLRKKDLILLSDGRFNITFAINSSYLMIKLYKLNEREPFSDDSDFFVVNTMIYND